MVLLNLSGCEKWQVGNAPVQESKDQPNTQAKVDSLTLMLRSAENQNRILSARLDEQLARETRLSEQVNKLKRENLRYRARMEVLASTMTAERAEGTAASQAEIDRLKDQIRQLKAKIDAMQPEP